MTQSTHLPTSAELANRELQKLDRLVSMLRRRGHNAVCQRLLSHIHVVEDFIANRQFSQALHAARCRMMG